MNNKILTCEVIFIFVCSGNLSYLELKNAYIIKDNDHLVQYLKSKNISHILHLYDNAYLIDGYYIFKQNKQLMLALEEYKKYISIDKSEQFIKRWNMLFTNFVQGLLLEKHTDARIQHSSLQIKPAKKFELIEEWGSCEAIEALEKTVSFQKLKFNVDKLWDSMEYESYNWSREYIHLNKKLNYKWSEWPSGGSILSRYFPPQYRHLLSNTQFKIKCSCGHYFIDSANDEGNLKQLCFDCRDASYTTGELKIKQALHNRSINFIAEFSFSKCKNINPLRFDFAILDKKNKVIMLVEYDGQQHFEPIDFAGRGEEWAKENFEYTRQNDQIKTQYCKDHNIPLLRIPYWEFDNIETILEEWLTEHGVLNQ